VAARALKKTEISSPNPESHLIAAVDLTSPSILTVLLNREFQSNISFRNIKLILQSLTLQIHCTALKKYLYIYAFHKSLTTTDEHAMLHY
jgi:replication-associated recombination protein RarA